MKLVWTMQLFICQWDFRKFQPIEDLDKSIKGLTEQNKRESKIYIVNLKKLKSFLTKKKVIREMVASSHNGVTAPNGPVTHFGVLAMPVGMVRQSLLVTKVTVGPWHLLTEDPRTKIWRPGKS